MYCTGWVKRGASGIIGTNISDAKETAAVILSDYPNSSIVNKECVEIDDFLCRKGIRAVSWTDYIKIEDEESRRGQNCKPPKPREKLLTIAEQLRIAFS